MVCDNVASDVEKIVRNRLEELFIVIMNMF